MRIQSEGSYPKPEKKEKKKSRIRKFSKKRAKENKDYSLNRKEFLEENPYCKVCGKIATTVHHKKGRIGGLLNDKRYFLPACDECHTKIELNPDWAKENGYSESRLSTED